MPSDPTDREVTLAFAQELSAESPDLLTFVYRAYRHQDYEITLIQATIPVGAEVVQIFKAGKPCIKQRRDGRYNRERR